MVGQKLLAIAKLEEYVSKCVSNPANSLINLTLETGNYQQDINHPQYLQQLCIVLYNKNQMHLVQKQNVANQSQSIKEIALYQKKVKWLVSHLKFYLLGMFRYKLHNHLYFQLLSLHVLKYHNKISLKQLLLLLEESQQML